MIIAGAVLLRVISGVGFANYDTLYALAWGGQLARGVVPAYGVPIAPTPHPADRGSRDGALPARAARRRERDGGARLPRAVGVRVGRLPAGRSLVRARRRRPGRADPAHARADPLLRRARLRGRALPAARARRPAGRVPPPPRRCAGARAARAGRPAAPRGMGVLGALLALHDRPDPPAGAPARACAGPRRVGPRRVGPRCVGSRWFGSRWFGSRWVGPRWAVRPRPKGVVA